MRSKTLIAVAGLAIATSLAIPTMAADGAATFKAKCAMCHGADGSGNTGMGKAMGLKDLGSAAVQSKSDSDLTTIITKGKGKMPSYEGKLSSDDIAGVVKYVRSLKK